MKTVYPEIKERLWAWWNHEEQDRPIFVKSPLSWPPRGYANREEWRDYWTNPEKRVADAVEKLSSFEPIAEEVKGFYPHFGPGSLALFMGSRPVWGETIYFEPCIDDLTSAPLPEWNEDNPYWQMHLRLLTMAKASLDGRARVGSPDLIEGLDVLASLRGTQNLVYDLIDCPDDCHRFLRRIWEFKHRASKRVYEIVKDEDGDSYEWGLVGPGHVAKLQCDFASVISPDMFQEFVVPYLQEELDSVDSAFWHLDGVDMIKFLDSLLSLDQVKAIQWTPGEGNPDVWSEEWFALYQRVLDAGKSLFLIGPFSHRSREVVKRLGKRGMALLYYCDLSEEEAEVIKESSSW